MTQIMIVINIQIIPIILIFLVKMPLVLIVKKDNAAIEKRAMYNL